MTNFVSEKKPGQATVFLAPALVNLFPGSQLQTEVRASTVGELIDQLDSRWPGMRDRLCEKSTKIRRHINIFVDGKRAAVETPLESSSKVYILTAISGG